MKILKTHGFTLIELMIALSVGVVLLGGMLQMLAASNQLLRNQQELSLIQENGRFTLSLMSRMLRQVDFSNTGVAIVNPLQGCDDADCALDQAAGLPAVSVTGVVGDTLQVGYHSLSDSVTDCQGQSDTANTFYNTFYVKKVAGVSSLYCRSSASVLDPALNPTDPDDDRSVLLVENIQNMQVLYGVDSTQVASATDQIGTANKYLNAAAIAADGTISMDNVVTLRLGLLVLASNNTKGSDDIKSHNVAGKAIIGNADIEFSRRLKRVFNVTIDLRNRD